MEAYRIGDFAKLNGVSVQLLKKYDQQGILCPAWKDETGRYYMDYQSIHLMECRFLSGAGLSLQEAQQLQNEGSLSDWHTQLSRGLSVIERKILEQQTLFQFVAEMRDCLEQIMEKKDWRVETWEGGWFMPIEQSLVYPWGKDGRPILQPWQRVILEEPLEPKGMRSHWGALLPKNFPYDMTGLDAIQDGSCFVYAHSLPGFNDQLEDFREPLRIMASNNLKPRGDLYQRRICITHDEKGAQTQVITRIPLQ